MIELFIRDDDVDSGEANLDRLISIGLKLRVPISFGIIPATLTKNLGNLLNALKRSHPELIELHQHGWAHVSHEGDRGEGEFGPARSYHQQRDDLQKGRSALEQTFGGGFFPAFSPPWNLYTADTVRAMKELKFLVLSAGAAYLGGSGQGIQHYPVTLDLLDWGGQVRLQPPRALLVRLFSLLKNFRGPVGLLLHHRRMSPEAFEFLESILHRLSQTGQVLFHTFESLEMKRMRISEYTAPQPVDQQLDQLTANAIAHQLLKALRERDLKHTATLSRDE